MEPGATEATMILAGVRSPRGLHFSPDGERLAFGGKPLGMLEGTYVLHLTTGALTRISDSELDWIAWFPDNQKIAGLVFAPTDQDPLRSEVAFVDAPP
jgi:hypothetical protein